MTPQPRILVVEDDRMMTHVLVTALKLHGYAVLHAPEGETGLRMAIHERPDLVILDVGLPLLDGFAVCEKLREARFEAPLLMLTGKTLVADRVMGLDAGADDYLAKPFEMEEFLARIKALLRRRRVEARPAVLAIGPTQVDLVNKTATRGGQPLVLTKTEFALLDLFARHAGRPVSRETMLNVVWGYTRHPTTRTIDTHVWRLRKKLGDDGAAPRWLKPVHGQGYCLEVGTVSPPEK
jgi:two-component system, OmpR family, response regulator MprA